MLAAKAGVCVRAGEASSAEAEVVSGKVASISCRVGPWPCTRELWDSCKMYPGRQRGKVVKEPLHCAASFLLRQIRIKGEGEILSLKMMT